VWNYTWRDYGNRVGVWRMMDAMDRYGVRGSVSTSAAVIDHHPEVIEACVERDWEIFSHGIYNTRYSLDMDEDEERAIIEDSMAAIERISGKRCDGWLAPALTPTVNTPNLLAEYGIKYWCDSFHDDQPTPIKVRSGRLISIPYSIEVNDTIVYNTYLQTPRAYGEQLIRQFDQLWEEGAESGTVMCIPLHPYLIGAPHRIEAFEAVLDHVTSTKDVWVTTGREIADYFYEHYYDTVLADIESRQRTEAV
jgi:peptidoglycan/xylan/chitin deacetylase (PgdA/CDA1 family)